ncbi:MAG: NGG1p interacting factor NIF3 [Patescibacteria group bacterium]|jgi:putative NIF3 family GTP cyclohydrolase 1 type 2
MMTVKSIYQLAVKLGIERDPRGAEFTRNCLKKEKKLYEKLPAVEQAYYDKEYLTNPYSDSRIIYTPRLDLPVKKIFAGIDCNEAELLLAKQTGDIDLVLAHHPEGEALTDLHRVMDIQIDLLEQVGVPVHMAEGLMNTRMGEVLRSIHPVNTQKAVDMARLLQQAFMCTHTTADNMVTTFFDRLITKQRKQLDTVGDVMELLMTIPEYQIAKRLKFGPHIFSGSEKRRLGKIVVNDMTGGTNGSKEIFEQLSRAGVGTLIGMHMREDHKKEAEKYHINVIIAGHIASDSLGMNLLLDEIEQRGVAIVPLGGLIRVKRFNKTKAK